MVIQLNKGERFNLSQASLDLKQVAIALGWEIANQPNISDVNNQSYDIDASVFALGKNGKIPDEKYLIFYNNLRSPDGSIVHSGDSKTGQNPGDDETINVDLDKVTAAVGEIGFCCHHHDGQAKQQNFSQIHNAFIRLYDRTTNSELVRYNLTEAFSEETAIEFGRLYQKDGNWRFQAVGEGYKAGLQSFVDKYHSEIPQETKPAKPTVELPQLPVAEASIKSEKAIALDKKLQEKAPHIFNLAKKAEISLAKANLTNHDAKVALCLDISGSMSSLYDSGKIQRLAEKILALGCRFDDNGSIDIFLFGIHPHNVGEMTIDNFSNFIHSILKQYPLEGGTYYGKVMAAIRKFYFSDSCGGAARAAIKADKPVYVMFVTDGETGDESDTKYQLQSSSYEPLFWQFMAIGKSKKDVKNKWIGGWLARSKTSNFGFLEQLDEMGDRYLDNADFFSIEDPEHIADEELYDLLTAEYPNWVKSARLKNILL
ncbi:MAG: stress protein [Microcoleus sp. SM1_3_4]|nr:stress protein [Microcoleus sp. SM1_3_4]